MALIDDLAARLKETTDDLEAELEARHRMRDGYQSEARAFQRDMTPVRAARKLLADYEAAGGNTNGKMPLTVIQQPVDYTPFVKPGGSHSPQLDALLCELGALGVRLDVLRNQ